MPADRERPDGDADFAYPRHPIIFYFKGLLPSLLLNATLQLASAAIFSAVEGWNFGDAFYHCLVTATTVWLYPGLTRTHTVCLPPP